MDRQCFVPRDRHLAAQAIEGEAPRQRVGLARLTIDQHIVALILISGAPKDEIEQRLALRREKAGPARIIRAERQHVARQQPLEEGPRLLPGNSQDRAVGEGGAGHRL